MFDLEKKEHVADLDDLILEDIGEPIYWLYLLTRKPFIISNISIFIDIDFDMKFKDRLNLLWIQSVNISQAINISSVDVFKKLLKYDGWTWNEYVFRTPIWMDDWAEIKVEDAKKLKELSWL